MNLSRAVLRREEFKTEVMGPLETWTDRHGFLWFGKERLNFGYFYINLAMQTFRYCAQRRNWVRVEGITIPGDLDVSRN